MFFRNQRMLPNTLHIIAHALLLITDGKPLGKFSGGGNSGLVPTSSQTATRPTHPCSAWRVILQSPSGLGSTAEHWIYGQAPLFKEPFWDVDSILIVLAPRAQCTRGGIHLGRELQVSDPYFEFSGKGRRGRNGTSPIGIAAFAFRSDRYRHRLRSYAARATPGRLFARVICGM